MAGEVDEKGRPIGVRRFETSAGRSIYMVPVETFPHHLNNIYIVGLEGGGWLMFDVGTMSDLAQGWLDRGLSQLEALGGPGDLDAIEHVVVSHAHIDHFGGIHRFRDRDATTYIHELDARVLSNFEERVVMASLQLELFLYSAGVGEAVRRGIVERYTASKSYFASVEIDRRLRQGDLVADGFEVLHVPGHCPGMIALRVEDIMLTADHVLSRITPNQAPQSITPFTGLEAFLRSLEKVYDVEGIRLGLGGHEAPIEDLRGRIIETARHHEGRLNLFLEHCASAGALDRGATISELSREVFGRQSGIGVYLALTEAGAHVEYLHQLGYLQIVNLEEVAAEERPAIRYRARQPGERLDLVAMAAERRAIST